MTIKTYPDIIQGTDEWHELRNGILTASEVKLITTIKTLKIAANDKQRAHVNEIAAQRISGFTEEAYVSDDMLRGTADEVVARGLYSENYSPVDECGFITNDKWGFVIGYSTDGEVGDDGLIEIKSRRQKFQVLTIASDEVPEEYMLQIQTGLLVTGRKWCDFISYSEGLPMFTKRVLPDEKIQSAIVAAAESFEKGVVEVVGKYEAALKKPNARLIKTERHTDEGDTIL